MDGVDAKRMTMTARGEAEGSSGHERHLCQIQVIYSRYDRICDLQIDVSDAESSYSDEIVGGKKNRDSPLIDGGFRSAVQK